MRVLADANRTFPFRSLLVRTLLLAALLPGALAAAAGPEPDTRRAAVAAEPCPSLADGRGRQVQGRGEEDSVGTAFAKHCAHRVPPPAPPKAVAPARPSAEAPAPALRVDSQRERDARSGAGGAIGRIGATLLTSGVVVWVLHSSLLASLLVLGVPLWRHVDLLPIVENGIRPATGSSESQEEESLPGVLGARAPLR